MKINTDPAFILKPSSIWDNSHTPCDKNKIITGQDDRGNGAIYGEQSRAETSCQSVLKS